MILVNDLQLGKHEISTEANFKVEKYWAEISAQIWVKWCPNISPPKIISADLIIRPNISPVSREVEKYSESCHLSIDIKIMGQLFNEVVGVS